MPEGLQVTVRPDGTLAVVSQAARGGGAYRATGIPSGTSPMYGAGGFFGVCDMDPVLVNAIVGPTGFERVMRWIPSDTESDKYDALTYIGSSGYAQSGMCSDCGYPNFRECAQTACFSRTCQQTGEHAMDQIGLRMNKNIPRISIFGNITDPAGNILLAQGQQIDSMFTLELIGAAYNLRRRLGTMLWTGNPAANLGGYWEHPGVYLVINTGKVDVNTNIACNALDAYIRSYGSAVIGAVGAPNIVDEIAAIVRSTRYRASGAELDESTMVTYIVMHPIHWDQVAQEWACRYGLNCANSGITMSNDALAVAELRDKFQSGMAVPIDGRMYSVILDNGIPLTPTPVGNETAFCGHISVITTQIEGETIFWGEYQDMNKTAGAVMAWFRSMFGASPTAISDGGRFLYAATTSGGFCFDARILAKRRIIARMPQLSGRLTNVCAIPLGTYPDVTGSGGLYERDGGPSSKPYLGLYGDCGDAGGTVITR